MSRTYSIGCQTCKESLWIGQGWPQGERYIYQDKYQIDALDKFLFSHIGHVLIFVDDEDIFEGEGKQYEAEGYLHEPSLTMDETEK